MPTSNFLTWAIFVEFWLSTCSGTRNSYSQSENTPPDLQNDPITPQINPRTTPDRPHLLNTCSICWYSEHFWIPFVLQGCALPGFLVRSRARQRIRFEQSVCRVVISLQKLVCWYHLCKFELFFFEIWRFADISWRPKHHVWRMSHAKSSFWGGGSSHGGWVFPLVPRAWIPG
jgi:hypothetical protein